MDTGFNDLRNAMSYEAVMRALCENYESIYVVDQETGAYQCFHESDSYSALLLENRGEDFFGLLQRNILRTVYPEDREYVGEKMSRTALTEALDKEKYYAFVYRLMIEGEPLYHKLRATRETVNGRPCILIGVRNVDAAFRQDKALAEAMSAMHQKEKNHLEAILASAAGYLEANLSQNCVLEISPYILSWGNISNFSVPAPGKTIRYSDLENWIVDNLVVENREKYIQVSSRRYLIRCFERGEKRASVSFSFQKADGQRLPCKKVFFLYQDSATADVMAFCVIYDLTEQQRKEKELRDLETELQMSRIRNFTSQMQPHFLYNALGSIQEIVLEDPEYASALIGDFTVHLRSCIRAMTNDAPIPFDQELANIKAYVNIEKMRLGEKLRVEYQIGVKDFSILPLSVQPLVENAIRHGVYERGQKGGAVIVRTAELKNAWQVIVEDTGVGFDVQAFEKSMACGNKDSTGLKNLIFRLDKVMHAAVDVKSTVGKGTTVVITIPKERGKNESNHRG